MIGWVITCSILLFLLILLLAPVSVRFSYQSQKIKASAHYLFVKIDFSPEAMAKRAEKKAGRAVEAEYKKQKKEEGAPAKEKKAAADTLKTIWSLVKASTSGLNILRRHLVFYKISAAIAVGGDDARITAETYGKLCLLIANSLAVLGTIFVVKEPKIAIRPDFFLEKTDFRVSLRARISPLLVLAAALNFLCRFLIVTITNKRKRKKIKGGIQHEPTTSCQ